MNRYNGRNGNGYQPTVDDSSRPPSPPAGEKRSSDGAAQIIQSLAERLDQVLRRGYVPPERQLWSAQDIAAYLGVSPRTVSERYAARPDFPKPIRLPSTGETGLKRWRASDVMTWAEGRIE